MNKKLQQLFEHIRQVSLTDSERAAMRSVLGEYARHKPVPVIDAHGKMSVWRWVFVHQRFATVGATVLVLFIAFGGTALAAEGALPGDALYGVKLGLNERVREAVAVTPEAQASWSVRRAERRLVEAEQLALIGELDEEKQQSLSLHIEEAFEEAVTRTNGLPVETQTQVEAQLSATLSVHGEVLASINGENEEVEEVRVLLSQAHESSVPVQSMSQVGRVPTLQQTAELEAVEEHMSEDNSQEPQEREEVSQETATGLLQAAQKSHRRAQKYKEQFARGDEFVRAEEALERAQEALEEGDTAEVVALSRASLEASQRIQVFGRAVEKGVLPKQEPDTPVSFPPKQEREVEGFLPDGSGEEAKVFDENNDHTVLIEYEKSEDGSQGIEETIPATSVDIEPPPGCNVGKIQRGVVDTFEEYGEVPVIVMVESQSDLSAVISVAQESSFVLKTQFTTIPGFAGTVLSQRTLEKFVCDERVVSIEEDVAEPPLGVEGEIEGASRGSVELHLGQ